MDSAEGIRALREDRDKTQTEIAKLLKNGIASIVFNKHKGAVK